MIQYFLEGVLFVPGEAARTGRHRDGVTCWHAHWRERGSSQTPPSGFIHSHTHAHTHLISQTLCELNCELGEAILACSHHVASRGALTRSTFIPTPDGLHELYVAEYGN